MRLVSAIYGNPYPFDGLSFLTELPETVHTPDELRKGDILVVWGGADISPSLYNKPLSSKTWAEARPSPRDMIEWELMKGSVLLDVPIIGVCRGAQMLCALAGGTLFQHVEAHGGIHTVETSDGRKFVTNSIHHQMMNPWAVEHEMLVSIKVPRSRVHFDVEVSEDVPEEPEYVYFPKVKGHAIQWHPEGMAEESPATQYIFEQIAKRV